MTANPGVYSTMLLQGNVTFNPGIYYVTGDITANAQSGTITLAGTGVTIVWCGSLSASGGSEFNMSAATREGAQNGAIPGMLFISSSKCKKANNVTTNNTTSRLTGVVYLPNGEITMGGTVEAGKHLSTGGCFNLVAQYIVFTDQARFSATGCQELAINHRNSGPRADLVR